MVNRKLIAGAAAVAVLTLCAGTAVMAQQGLLTGQQEDEASGRDDDATERPITGSSLEQASKAALTQIGGGEVTETEVGDEEGFYEVEVTRADGSQVDVHLDRGFNVLGTEGGGATEDSS